MTREEIIAKLKETAPALHAEGVTGLRFLAPAPGGMQVPTVTLTCWSTSTRKPSSPFLISLAYIS
jgi:hypothetical protein